MSLPVNVKELLIDYFGDNDVVVIKDEINITTAFIEGLISALENEDLLPEVKNYLDITWNDEATDRKVRGIMERGIRYINKVAGKEMDYTKDDKPKELLLDYCRYVRSNALDQFQNNYLHELLTLQMAEEVADYETNNSAV